MANIANPIQLNPIAKEVATLASTQLITQRGKFQVYLAQANDIPTILQKLVD